MPEPSASTEPVPTPVATAPEPPSATVHATPTRATPGLAAWRLIVVFGAWSTFVWTVRLRNIWQDLLLSTNEKVATSLVALVFVVLGVAVVTIGIGLRRWPLSRGDTVAIGVLAGWTVGAWLTRMVDIVGGGDHDVPFVAVHTALALVSVGLALLSWRVLARGVWGHQSTAVALDAGPVGPGALDPERERPTDGPGPVAPEGPADAGSVPGGARR